MIGRKFRAVIAALVVLAWGHAAEAAPGTVVVGIAPLRAFVERIGGGRVQVEVLLPAGRDPHVYEPLPKQMVALSKAKAYVSIGLPFESALIEKVTKNAPSLRVIRADEGIAPIPMLESTRVASAPKGKKAHEHEEGASDPHVWCSPKNAVLIASNILGGLIAADPEGDIEYRAGYESLLKDIAALDDELTALFSGRSGMRFLVFHPAWGYFARDYDLVQLSVEVEGKEPRAVDLQRIMKIAADADVRVLFIAPGVSKKAAGTIADALGAKIAAADPLASDWMANMRAVAVAFAAALK